MLKLKSTTYYNITTSQIFFQHPSEISEVQEYAGGGGESQPWCIRVWSRDEAMPPAIGCRWFNADEQPIGALNSIIQLLGHLGSGMALFSQTFFQYISCIILTTKQKVYVETFLPQRTHIETIHKWLAHTHMQGSY